jgi:hypothetical protein
MSAEEAVRQRSAFDLEVATDRLKKGMAATAVPREAGRNPFRFVGDERVTGEPRQAQPLGAPPAAAPVVVAPTVSLIGIVERTVNGTPVRVAVVSMADTLYYVSAGERIGMRYEVVVVTADAIELKDLAEGASRRVALR